MQKSCTNFGTATRRPACCVERASRVTSEIYDRTAPLSSLLYDKLRWGPRKEARVAKRKHHGVSCRRRRRLKTLERFKATDPPRRRSLLDTYLRGCVVIHYSVYRKFFFFFLHSLLTHESIPATSPPLSRALYPTQSPAIGAWANDWGIWKPAMTACHDPAT